MEVLLAIFILAGIGGGTFWASSFYDKHATAQRAIEINRANWQEKKDNQASQRQLEQYFKEAREAEEPITRVEL